MRTSLAPTTINSTCLKDNFTTAVHWPMSKGQAYNTPPQTCSPHLSEDKIHNATISLDLSLWVDPVQNFQIQSFTIQAAQVVFSCSIGHVTLLHPSLSKISACFTTKHTNKRYFLSSSISTTDANERVQKWVKPHWQPKKVFIKKRISAATKCWLLKERLFLIST